MRTLNLRLRSPDTSSSTSSSLSVHSCVVIQSRPLKSALLISTADVVCTGRLLETRDIREMHATGIGHRFQQQFELEIGEHIDRLGWPGARLGTPGDRLVPAQAYLYF